MSFLSTIGVAASALLRTKTRSLLTMLGVIIGVGAVIAMVSIGEGARVRVAETFEKMGTNLLVVSSGAVTTGGSRGGAGTELTLTWEDLAAVAASDGLAGVAPQMRSAAQVVSELGNWQTSVTGTTPTWFELRNWPVESGELFTEADVAGARKVAVLGRTVVDNLFGDDVDPVGKSVRIANVPFLVIGVAAKKGTSPNGSDYDDVVIVPATTFAAKVAGGLQKFIRGDILAAAAPGAETATVKEAIAALLRERHRIRDGEPDDFNVRDMSEIASARKESTDTITSLLAGVSLVSLIVGGIGIMNIMLVSVTERTREIGLRIAVGAKPRTVLAQFLVEAVALSVAGGLIGIAAGIAAGEYMAAQFGFPLQVSANVVVLAVGVSGLVGVAFGLFPALQAARLDPIDALRHE